MSRVVFWIKSHLELLSFASALFCLALGFLFLPLHQPIRSASPDETAYRVMIERLEQGGSGRVFDQDALNFPWLHPRSWISDGPGIVPVGFLGVPAFAFVFFGAFPDFLLPFLVSLFIFSSSSAFYFLLKPRFGHWPALVGVLVCFTFPVWIYYGNRSLFANGIQLALLLWSLCLFEQLPFGKRTKSVFFGLLAGLAIAVRPFELIWMLPIWIWWLWQHRSDARVISMLIGLCVGILPSLVIACMIYGSPFVFGYWLSGNPMPADVIVPSVTVTHSPLLFRWLPYGIHPRTMWWNAKQFSIELLWPWLMASLISLAIWWKQKMARPDWILIVIIAWTTGVLLTVYGSGLYQDHVRVGAITIGNSFLRYLMPLSLVMGLLLALATASLKWNTRLRQGFGIVACLVMIPLGGWMAFAKDDEGLISVQRELARYDMIVQKTGVWFAPGSVIVSPRSDKIFFPEYRAVSPTPSQSELIRYMGTMKTSIGYFDRTLSQDKLKAWQDLGVQVELLQTFGNESLYRLTLSS